MTWLRQFLFRLRSLFRKGRLEAEMAEEIRLHLEMQTEANLAAGMPPDEAHFAARREFGGIDQVKERYRDERRPISLEDCWRDLCHSARGLFREKGFTATVLAIFALCVAANVAVFSMVNGILLRPLPFPEPGGILSVNDSYPKAGVKGGVSVPHYLERRQQIRAFAESAAMRSDWVTIGTGSASEGVEAMLASPSLFSLLRCRPVIGRTFTEDEGVQGHCSVAILSDELWRRRFNADPAVVGQTIRIDDVPHVVIGVLPGSFRYPGKHPMIWMPLAFTDYERLDGMRHANYLGMIVRLREGVSLAEARSELDELNRRTLKQDPGAKIVIEAGFCSVIESLHSEFVSQIRPALLLLQSGAAFLMLIGAVNLANLLLVRATGHAKEYSVRRALGAGSFRLGRALVLETLLLSVTGGALGLVAGAAGLRLTLRYIASRLPFEVSPGPDGTVCAVTLTASVIFGIMLALPVLWHSLREDMSVALASESRSGTTSRAVHRLRHSLIVAQIALAFVLLEGTGLLAFSLARVLSVDPGFQRENVFTGIVGLPRYSYPDDKKRLAFVERLTGELRTLPGVLSSGVDSGLPFTWGAGGITVQFKSHALLPGEGGQPHPVSSVSGDLFASLGIPLVEGRLINGDDVEAGRKVCVVDADFARRYWPKGDALGHGITPDMAPNPDFYTIVGIVGPVKQTDLTDERTFGAVYLPYGGPLFSNSSFWVVVRTSQGAQAAGRSIQAALSRVDPELILGDLQAMSERVTESTIGRRISLSLAAAYAGVALVLAAIGIYGVLAYSVAQRRREIGVRMALGAQPEQILWQFLRMGFRFLAMGLPLGCLGAVLLARAMASFLYGVGPANVPVLVGTAAVLGGVSMVACVLPARRGAQVSPAEALRAN